MGRVRCVSRFQILLSSSYPPRCFLRFSASRFSAHLTVYRFTCARRAGCCTHWALREVFDDTQLVRSEFVYALCARSVHICVAHRVTLLGHTDRMRHMVRHTRFTKSTLILTTSLSLGNSLSLGDVHISKIPAHFLRTESERQCCAPLSAPRHSLTTSPPQRECGVHVANSCT